MTNYHIEKLASENALVGEGPMWDSGKKVLYWIDIQGKKFWEYNPKTNLNILLDEGFFVAGVVPNKKSGLCIATWEGVKIWDRKNKYKWLFSDSYEGKKFKLNDVIPSPNGDLIGGSAHLDTCTLFNFKKDGNVEIIDDGLGLCNGMGFSPDLKTFYSTDSLNRQIFKWDYNYEKNSFSNKTELIKIPISLGLPDGMTVDSEGFIWSAIWHSAMVIRFDPDGVEERRINLPAAQSSSVMFGGENLNELYITSASITDPTGVEPKGYDNNLYRGGDLYRIKLDIQGKNEFITDFNF